MLTYAFQVTVECQAGVGTMRTLDTDSGTRAQRFNELLAEYEICLDKGQVVDREEFIRDHPEFQNELREHFDGVDALRALAESAGATSPRLTLEPGFQLGDYELLELLGRGGMGVVYRARQKTLNRIVAVKMLQSLGEGDADDVERFFGEAEAAARLQHPHIVRIYEVGEQRGHPFFAMDLVEGQSLANAIAQNPLPQRIAAECLRKIAEAMQFAHDHGVVHRDLKPANVLLDRHGEPRITDFGLAKRSDCDSKLTATGIPMGTASYMPPEQARGDWHEVGVLSDVYSLGATLYDLLVGRPPFLAAGWHQVREQVLNQEPVSPRVLNPTIHRDLETICLKCLQKRPGDRYGSAQELADDLGRYLRGEPIHARPISAAERAWRWCRRYPLAVAAIASLAVGLCLALVFFWHAERARRDAESARQEAETNFRDARGAVDDLLTTVGTSTLLNQPGLQPVRRRLLEQARDYYREFRQRTSADPGTELENARIVYRLAAINSALGEASLAHELFVEACAALAAIHPRLPDDPEVLDAYAAALMEMGISFHKRREWDRAAAHFGRAGELRRQLKQRLETSEGTSWLQRQPSAVQRRLAAVDRLIANAVKNRGDAEFDRWRHQTLDSRTFPSWEEARESIEEARTLLAELTITASDDPDVRRDLAQAEYTLGRCFWELQRLGPVPDQEYRTRALAKAEVYFERAARQFELLLAQRDGQRKMPDCFDYLDAQYRYATVLRLWGDALYSSSRLEQAVEKHHAAVRVFEMLAESNPDVPSYRLETARACQSLAISLLKGLDEGEEDLFRSRVDQVKRILDELDEEYPNEPALQEGIQELQGKLQQLLQLLDLLIDDRRVEEPIGPPGALDNASCSDVA